MHAWAPGPQHDSTCVEPWAEAGLDSWHSNDESWQGSTDHDKNERNPRVHARNLAHTKAATHRFAGRRRILRNSSSEALGHFVDESIDWLFIDTSHTYVGVRRELQQW